jgi:hypothetical protein
MIRKVGLLGSWSPILSRVLAPGGTPGDGLLGAFCPHDPPRKPRKTPPGTRGDSGGRFAAESTRSATGTLGFSGRADVAQLVEHLRGKEGVPGSSPGVGLASESRFSKRFQAVVKVPAERWGTENAPANTESKHPQVPPGTAHPHRPGPIPQPPGAGKWPERPP